MAEKKAERKDSVKKAKERSQREFQGREREKTGGKSKVEEVFSEKESEFTDPSLFADKKLKKAADKKNIAKKNYEKVRAETQKTAYSMQKVYDEATGSYVYKVVADKKDANVNRSLTKKKMYRKFMYEAEAATKAKAMEDADDNDAVNAASGV